MLHAFLRKGVKEVMANEDAVTSMVFTPLVFMAPKDALSALSIILGDHLGKKFNNRKPIGHFVYLWPPGLKAESLATDGKTRREPDLVVKFDFDSGKSVVIIGEMKWDTPSNAEKLISQVERERQAVKKDSRFKDHEQIFVVITKSRLALELGSDCLRLTWTEIHGRLRLRPSTGVGPVSEWAQLIAEYLERAKQTPFLGFLHGLNCALAPVAPVFFKADTRWFIFNEISPYPFDGHIYYKGTAS